MATRSLKGRVPPPLIKLQLAEDGSVPPSEVTRLAGTLQQVLSILSGGLSFGTGQSSYIGGNTKSQFVDYVFVAASTYYSIPHGLDTVPIGFLVVISDRACNVYDGNFGAAWGTEVVTLACDTAGAKVKLLLLS